MGKYDEMLMVEQICQKHEIPVPKQVQDYLQVRGVPKLIALERNGMIELGRVVKLFGMRPRAASQLLKVSGYVRHPALKRAEGKLRLNGKLTRIYVRRGHPAMNARYSIEVAEIYNSGLKLQPLP
jgi:hypothetical protein